MIPQVNTYSFLTQCDFIIHLETEDSNMWAQEQDSTEPILVSPHQWEGDKQSIDHSEEGQENLDKDEKSILVI